MLDKFRSLLKKMVKTVFKCLLKKKTDEAVEEQDQVDKQEVKQRLEATEQRLRRLEEELEKVLVERERESRTRRGGKHQLNTPKSSR